MKQNTECQRIRINGQRWTYGAGFAETRLMRLGVLAHVAVHAVILATLGASVRVYGAGNAVISVEGALHA